jgi:hypothetical protein
MIAVLLLLQVATASGGRPRQQPVVDSKATRMEMRMTVVTGENAADSGDVLMRNVMTIRGDSVRTDADESLAASVMLGGSGTYTLTHDGARTVFGVDTVKREYWEIDEGRIVEELDDAVSSLESIPFRFSDVSSEVENLGLGETIEGFATTHWRHTQKMTMKMGIPGMPGDMRMEQVTDLYYSAELTKLMSARSASPVIMGDLESSKDLPFLDSAGTAAITAARAKLPRTIPIRSVERTTTTAGPVKSSKVTITEIRGIAAIEVPALFFAIPAGYKKVEMPEAEPFGGGTSPL